MQQHRSDPPTIHALTIQQPYASLFALGAKQMETRSWNTHVRGPVAIHAGKGNAGLRLGQRRWFGPWEVERDRSGLLLRHESRSVCHRLPQGAVVAIGDLFQTRRCDSPEHGPSDDEAALGVHAPGMWAWSITSMSPLGADVVPATGQQGWWRWQVPDDVPARLLYPGVLTQPQRDAA